MTLSTEERKELIDRGHELLDKANVILISIYAALKSKLIELEAEMGAEDKADKEAINVRLKAEQDARG